MVWNADTDTITKIVSSKRRNSSIDGKYVGNELKYIQILFQIHDWPNMCYRAAMLDLSQGKHLSLVRL